MTWQSSLRANAEIATHEESCFGAGGGMADTLQAPAMRGEPLPVTCGKHAVPSYLRDVYRWAYLDRRNALLLDHEAVVTALLWGNSGRLRRALLAEISAGQRVMQAAHVYGRLIPEIARAIGPTGHFDVIDVAPLQAALCRRKLRGFSNARTRVADASNPQAGTYDVIVCFFLLHELPGAYKRAVVNALLARAAPGGKVVFVDYHAPGSWHPLRGLMRHVYARLEPFAESMWHHEIAGFASEPDRFAWRKETFFGGLYQKTVASHIGMGQEHKPSPSCVYPCHPCERGDGEK